ncbi:hypothetical protein [Actinocorallia libanotica]
MTTVNWERESGEKIEEFVAALLLLKHPHGNQPTPSRGDRGVDVRVWNPDGYDIYQVKRYSRPLTAKQATSVKDSWKTFTAKTLPALPVRSWTLVTPWEPSNERLEWLEELTAGCGIRVSWMGGRILDGMAAENPALVDYFFGDGGRRLERLMTMALHGGQDVPQGAAGEDLLAAIVSRQQSLAASLNEVDPFYRYEVQVRTGRVKDLEWDADLNTDPLAAFVRYLQVNEACHLVIKLLPRCAESARLRPITMSVDLEVPPGSAEQQAVADWQRYGSPFHNVPATITHVSGPPGITPVGGPGQISFLAAASQNHLPDLEIRLTARDGTGDLTLGLRDPQVSSGQDGSWLAGVDYSGVLTFQVLLNGTEDKQDRIQMSMSSLTGTAPADVLPAVRLVAALPHAEEVVLAVRGGRPLTPVWEPEASQFAGAPLGRLLAQRCRTFTDPLLNSAPASTGAEELVRVLLDAVRKLKEALAAAGPDIAQDDGISRVMELRKACQQVLVSESICWQRAASRVQTAVLRSWGARVTESPERGEAGQETVPREYAWAVYRLDAPHHSRAAGQAEEPGPARAQAEEALRALAACAEGRSVKGGQVLR